MATVADELSQSEHIPCSSSSSVPEPNTLIVSELLTFVSDKINTMPYDMLVKLLTDFYSDDDITTAKAVLYDTAFCSRDTPRLIKRKGKDKNISNVQDIVNIFLEMPPSSFPSYVAKDLSRLPPLSMNCFDIASLVKYIESLKIHTSILQESYESVVKAQLLACQNTNEITPEDATAETVQPVSTDPVCASPTVSQMLDDTDPIAQHESDDDDLLLLASLQQTSSSSSTGQLQPAKTQSRFSSYADSVKTGRRKTNAKSSRSTKPPTNTDTHSVDTRTL